MNWSKFKKILRIFGTIIGLGIFIYLIIDTSRSLRENVSLLTSLSWINLGFAFVIYLLVYFLQMINYFFMLKRYGYAMGLMDVMSAYFISFLYKYIPGYIWGYFYRSDRLNVKNNITHRVSWYISFLEIVTTILSGCLLIVVDKFINGNLNVVFLVMMLLSPIISWLVLKEITPFINKFFKIKSDSQVNFSISLKDWFGIQFNSIMQWVLLGLSLYLIYVGVLGTNIFWSVQHVLQLISMFSISWISGFIAFIVPNGLGVRDLTLKGLLTTTFALDLQYAAILAIISRILLLIAEGLWIVIGALIKSKKE